MDGKRSLLAQNYRLEHPLVLGCGNALNLDYALGNKKGLIIQVICDLHDGFKNQFG